MAQYRGNMTERDPESSRRKVCYFYDGSVGNYYYGMQHPMKPHRVRMAHNLLLNYGLFKKMQIYVSPLFFSPL